VKQYTLIKDGVLTLIAVFVFCALFFAAEAYQDETDAHFDKKPQPNIERESATIPTPLRTSQTLARPISTLNVEVSESEAIEEKQPSFVTEKKIAVSKLSTPVKERPKEVLAQKKPLPGEEKKSVVTSKLPAPITESSREVSLVTKTAKVETPLTQPSQSISNNSEYVQELMSLIAQQTNAIRAKEDLSPLQRDTSLEKNAKSYSVSMQKTGTMSHTDASGCDLNCRFEGYGYEALSWGENLATMNFSQLPSAKEVAATFMKEWQKSAGHRKNLLSSNFTHQGIGIAVGKNDLYVVVQFAKPM